MDGIELLVVGAHLQGQPLNSEVVALGGVLVRATVTAATYRLFALDTTPPKPGLVRSLNGGVAVSGEVWRLPAVGFARFVAALPAPMVIGSVELTDGARVSGFLVEPYAVIDAVDISAFGGWVAYLDSTRSARSSSSTSPV